MRTSSIFSGPAPFVAPSKCLVLAVRMAVVEAASLVAAATKATAAIWFVGALSADTAPCWACVETETTGSLSVVGPSFVAVVCDSSLAFESILAFRLPWPGFAARNHTSMTSATSTKAANRIPRFLPTCRAYPDVEGEPSAQGPPPRAGNRVALATVVGVLVKLATRIAVTNTATAKLAERRNDQRGSRSISERLVRNRLLGGVGGGRSILPPTRLVCLTGGLQS